MELQEQKRSKRHKNSASEVSPELIIEAEAIQRTAKDREVESCKKKRKRLSYNDKKQILEELNYCSEALICQKYGISDRSLREWKKAEKEIVDASRNSQTKNSKTIRDTRELDDRLLKYLLESNKQGISVTGVMIRQEALRINEELEGPKDFRASEGWLGKWKKRKDVRSLKITGEKLSANIEAAENYKEEFIKIIATKELNRTLCFNMDESSLPFKETPNRTLAPRTLSHVSGMKKQQERVTVAACCNADGSFKLPLIIIGKSANPRCLNSLDKTKLPVWYRHQKSSWMDKTIFEEWFTHEFVPRVKILLKSKNLPPRVVLLVDNCRSHKYLKVDDIEVAFLPPNVTSIIQPLDQGVLQTLKLQYQQLLVDSILRAQRQKISIIDHLKTINIKTVIEWAAAAWEKVEPYTMYKSWNKIWPVMKKDVETQTEVDSCPVLMALDASIGTESVNGPLVSDDAKVSDLLKSIQKIEGYGDVDQNTVWKWLSKPKEIMDHWSDTEIKDQVDAIECNESNHPVEESIFVGVNNPDKNQNDIDLTHTAQ